MEHKNHLMMVMAHACTPLSLVEGESYLRIDTHLDPSTPPITSYKLTRTLIIQILNKAEKDVSSLLDGVRCVVISYDLWMSKMTQDILLMTANYTCDHVRKNAQIGRPITTSTDGDSLVVTVSNAINHFSLGSKLVCITSDGRTNLTSCKVILESNSDNTGVFE